MSLWHQTWHKYVAEFLGTLALTLAVLVGLTSTNPSVTPVLAALTLGLFVYSIGHISGAHLNPAVTIGAWSIGKIVPKDVFRYILAQFLGALAARWIAGMMIVQAAANISTRSTSLLSDPKIAIAEAVGMFFFAFGIASVIYGRTPSDLSGVVVGGSLFLGIAIASTVSNGVLNPAVALGIGSLNLMYFLGPVIGAPAGMWAYRHLSS